MPVSTRAIDAVTIDGVDESDKFCIYRN